MILTRFISKKLLSRQLKKPSGWVGKYIITKLLNNSSHQLNSYALELLNVQKKDKILEIGFGTGLLIQKIVKKLDTGSIHGVDFSQTMYNQATKINKKSIKEKRVILHFLECKYLPFNQETFHKVCSVNTLYFWENPEEYFKEILRVIKKDGHFILGFREKKQMELLDADHEVFNLYSNEEIISMLKESGFSSVILKEKKDSPLISYCIDAIK